MPAQRKAQIKSYITLPNGKQAHIPSISKAHFWEYKILGITKAKTLKQLQEAADKGLRIMRNDLHDGKIQYRWKLNFETADWDKVEN
jgi:hypothetical protein